METTNVLFTACCGWPTCGTISALKKGKHGRYRVVGCDCSPDPAALNYVDALYGVPRCDSDDFIPSLIKVCKDEKIDVLVPLISDEIGVLNDNRDEFDKIGVKMLLSGADSLLDVANDKLRLYEFLTERGVNVMPRSKRIDASTLMEDLVSFGYPDRPVCVKMIDGCGSAGLRIVDEKKAREMCLNVTRASRSNPYITAAQLAEACNGVEKRFMLQEYLDGEESSAICLVDHGRTVYSPSHRNSVMQNATAVVCELVDDKDANEIAATVNRLLALDGNIGLDFKRDANGRLWLIDVNPRISATVALAEKAGLNLVEMGVMHALGIDVDENVRPLYGLKLTRNYGTLYQYEGRPYGR